MGKFTVFFRRKKARRRLFARLPLEQKFQMLLEMQQTTSAILRSRNIHRPPWMTFEFFQVTADVPHVEPEWMTCPSTIDPPPDISHSSDAPTYDKSFNRHAWDNFK